MSIPPQYAGTGVTTTVTFTNPGSATPVDPTTVTLVYRAGGAASTTWTYGGAGSITKVSTGVYTATLDTTTAAGTWTVKWTGTGACAAVGVAQFEIDTPPI